MPLIFPFPSDTATFVNLISCPIPAKKLSVIRSSKCSQTFVICDRCFCILKMLPVFGYFYGNDCTQTVKNTYFRLLFIDPSGVDVFISVKFPADTQLSSSDSTAFPVCDSNTARAVDLFCFLCYFLWCLLRCTQARPFLKISAFLLSICCGLKKLFLWCIFSLCKLISYIHKHGSTHFSICYLVVKFKLFKFMCRIFLHCRE